MKSVFKLYPSEIYLQARNVRYELCIYDSIFMNGIFKAINVRWQLFIHKLMIYSRHDFSINQMLINSKFKKILNLLSVICQWSVP